MASIHVSPSFLKPHALAGTLTPSGLDSLPPDFTPCWKALHPTRGTSGSCSHQLPVFSPLRLSKSSIAKSSLPSAPAERSSHWVSRFFPPSFGEAGRNHQLPSHRCLGSSHPPWPAPISPGSPAFGSFAPSLQLHLLLAHFHLKLLLTSVLLLFFYSSLQAGGSRIYHLRTCLT